MVKLLAIYGVAFWLFLAVGAVYVCVQLAGAKNREPVYWGLFAFLFGWPAAVYLYMLPERATVHAGALRTSTWRLLTAPGAQQVEDLDKAYSRGEISDEDLKARIAEIQASVRSRP